MTLNDYQEQAMGTCMKTCDNYAYMSEGLDGEVGELKSKVAKLIRSGRAKVSNNVLVMLSERTERAEIIDGLKKELGDVLWFVSGMATVMGWRLDDVAQVNLAKLADRANRGKIEGEGDNR